MSLNLTESQMLAVRRYYGFSDNGPSVQVDSRYGADALFIPIDDKHGVKFYYNEVNAKRYYHWMRILSTMGLATRVWDLGCISLVKNRATRISSYAHRTIWYFYTERAAVLSHIYTDNKPEQLTRLRKKAISRLNALGIGHGDSHSGNFGIVGGRCVVIDVGGLHTIPDYDYLT